MAGIATFYIDSNVCLSGMFEMKFTFFSRQGRISKTLVVFFQSNLQRRHSYRSGEIFSISEEN